MKRTLLILILSTLTLNALWSEDGSRRTSQVFSMENCVETALKNNPQIKIAEQKILSAKAKKREAFSGYLPNISGSASYIKRKEVEGASALSGITSVSPTFRFSFADEMYDNKLTLTQPVFTWGKIYQSNRQATLNYKYTEEEYRKTKQEVIYKTKEAFYRYILARQMVSISKEAFDVTEAHLKVIEKFYDEGRSSSYDVSRAKVSLANTKTNLIRAENDFNLAKQSLVNILNIKEKDVDFSGDLEYVPLDIDLDSLLNDAMNSRPELNQIMLLEDISKSLVKLTSAGNKPNIAVTGYTEWQNTKWETKGWYNTWTTMAILTVPIFDGFSTFQKTKQAKSNLEQVKLSKEALEEGIKLEVRAAYLNYKQAKESIEANKENVATAKENLDTAQERYKLGLMSDIEVRDAQFALTQAETNYTQALYDYNIALASVEKARGITK
ncbi:MAG: Outer membrane protein TolC precursor [Elusimicrobia bacterium ADurb.Bin231]|nr:MAG: Outer membrane protein TolC precursor [Elusimicrobia bacterium ADurb.Bin231]